MTRNAWLRSLWRDAWQKIRTTKGDPRAAFGVYHALSFLDSREYAALMAYRARGL